MEIFFFKFMIMQTFLFVFFPILISCSSRNNFCVGKEVSSLVNSLVISESLFFFLSEAF